MELIPLAAVLLILAAICKCINIVRKQPKLKKYIYIRCNVAEQTENHRQIASVISHLKERITYQPTPDIVPPVLPGQLSFQHVVVLAFSIDEAYAIGAKQLKNVCQFTITFNDYVIEL